MQVNFLLCVTLVACILGASNAAPQYPSPGAHINPYSAESKPRAASNEPSTGRTDDEDSGSLLGDVIQTGQKAVEQS
ncbi:hypothetical protein MBANPS3_010250 [Mucor bainieri]